MTMICKEHTSIVPLNEMVLTHVTDNLHVGIKVASVEEETLTVVVVRDLQRLTGKIKLKTLADALARALAEEQLDAAQREG